MTHWYNYGTNYDLEVMVSKSIMQQVTPNYARCFIILCLILLIPYFKTKCKLYLCYVLAPILALTLIHGIKLTYFRKIAKGYVHYEFVTINTDNSITDSMGNTVSMNISPANDGDVYIVTDTLMKPYKLSTEEKELYRYIMLSQ